MPSLTSLHLLSPNLKCPPYVCSKLETSLYADSRVDIFSLLTTTVTCCASHELAANIPAGAWLPRLTATCIGIRGLQPGAFSAHSSQQPSINNSLSWGKASASIWP